MRNGEIHQGLVDPDRKENTSFAEEKGIQWEFGQIVRHRPTHDPFIPVPGRFTARPCLRQPRHRQQLRRPNPRHTSKPQSRPTQRVTESTCTRLPEHFDTITGFATGDLIV